MSIKDFVVWFVSIIVTGLWVLSLFMMGLCVGAAAMTAAFASGVLTVVFVGMIVIGISEFLG